MGLDMREYREALQRAADLQRCKDFDGALRVIDELLAHDPHSSALHVRRGIFLQLSSVDRPLEEVEQALQHACALDETNIDARLELGHFSTLFAIDRDTPSNSSPRLVLSQPIA